MEKDGFGRLSLAMPSAALRMASLGNQFSLFGKLRLLRTDIDLSASGVGGSASESDSETGLHFGVGAMFDLGRNFPSAPNGNAMTKPKST